MYAILLAAVAWSCSVETTTDQNGWKISDAYIAFAARGQHVFIIDSGGFEAARMVAAYSRSDSMFSVMGRTGDIMLSFVFRAQLDTGITSLDLPTILFYYDSVRTIPLRFHGNATVYFPDGSWSTDSLHKGTIKITQFDSSNGTFSGAFSFSAIDTLRGSPLSDTIRIDSGVISKMRIQIN